MGKLKELGNKLMSTPVKKSWFVLSYLYLVLPALLYLLADLSNIQSMSKIFATLFHNYGIFCVNVIPSPANFTGLVGLCLAVWFVVAAMRKKDWVDVGICLAMIALNAAYFLLGWNYWLLQRLGGL